MTTTAATTTYATTSTITREEIAAAVNRLEEIGDPIARYMRRAGFDPDHGAILVVPTRLWSLMRQIGPVPSYVRPSAVIEAPVMINTAAIWEVR